MKPRTHKLLLDLHLYLGLLCAPYLILYGISALAFNHEWRSERSETSWEAQIEPLPITAPATTPEATVANAELARERLGLIGNVPAWRVKLEGGALAFYVGRPGARYEVSVAANGRARVDKSRGGVLSVLRGLHGSHGFGGSSWARTWRFYTDLSLLGFGVSVSTGLLIWARRRGARVVGSATLALGAAAFSLALAALW
jgi:hypothetical protein